jgi:hypothetical protein
MMTVETKQRRAVRIEVRLGLCYTYDVNIQRKELKLWRKVRK